MTLLRINGLHLSLLNDGKPTPVLAGVSLSIQPGETVALLGESGSGKSMTALSIMRLLPKGAKTSQHSSITWANQELTTLPEVDMREIRGRRIAMIFQEPMTSLNPVLTIEQQLSEVLAIHFNMVGEAARKRILELLDSVGIPAASHRLNQYPHQLSGGMKQRVMIAMALAGEPDLLIADEPTTALDVTVQAQVLALLKELQKKLGMSILLITHDLGVVHAMADRILVMYAGHIVEAASHEQFFQDPKHPYTKKLFSSMPSLEKRNQELSVIKGQAPAITRVLTHCRFAPRCEFAWDSCREIVPRWIGANNQNGVRCHLYDPNIQAVPQVVVKDASTVKTSNLTSVKQEPLLEVSHLQVFFPLRKGLMQRVYAMVKAVDDVSLQLFPASTLAIVGESGCGKTTIAQAILQLISSTSGKIVFQGHSEYQKMRSDLQIIFQDPYSSMNPRMLVGDIISEGLRSLKILRNEKAIIARVDELLLEVGLPLEAKYRYPHQFSGGQRQRIAIARALAVKPKLIICDEPTSALDVSVQAQILNLLEKLQNEHGISFLFITHNISVVSYLADRVAVMYLGRIVEQGSVDDILENPKHPYTQALLKSVPELNKSPEEMLQVIKGELPSPINPPSGCYFHPRCPFAMAICSVKYPGITELNDGRQVNCYLYSENTLSEKNSNVVPLRPHKVDPL